MNTTHVGDRGTLTRQLIKESLHLLRVLRRRNLLSSPSTSLAKDLILSNDPAIFDVLRSFYPFSCLSDLHQFSTFLKKIEENANGYGENLLTEVFDTYKMEDAHIIANRGSREIMSSNKDATGGSLKNLVYGEVEFGSFVEVLNVASEGLQKKHKFVDLGSGTAKALCVAAVSTDFDQFVGIEIIPGLHDLSTKILKVFHEIVSPRLMRPPECCYPPQISLFCGSFLSLESTHDWTDADVVFANSTCFSNELISSIEVLARGLRIGARVITFTVPLTSDYFAVIYKKRMVMSWGPATVFISTRVSDDEAKKNKQKRESDERDHSQRESHKTSNSETASTTTTPSALPAYTILDDIDDDSENEDINNFEDESNSGGDYVTEIENLVPESYRNGQGNANEMEDDEEGYDDDIDDQVTTPSLTTFDGNSFMGSRSGLYTLGSSSMASSVDAVIARDLDSMSTASDSSIPSTDRSPDLSVVSKTWQQSHATSPTAMMFTDASSSASSLASQQQGKNENILKLTLDLESEEKSKKSDDENNDNLMRRGESAGGKVYNASYFEKKHSGTESDSEDLDAFYDPETNENSFFDINNDDSNENYSDDGYVYVSNEQWCDEKKSDDSRER